MNIFHTPGCIPFVFGGALMCFARARLLADVSKNYFRTALQPWAVDTPGRKWEKREK